MTHWIELEDDIYDALMKKYLEHMRRMSNVVMFDNTRNLMLLLEPGELESKTKYYVIDRSTSRNIEKGESEVVFPR